MNKMKNRIKKINFKKKEKLREKISK
jgi:hypothetical protein